MSTATDRRPTTYKRIPSKLPRSLDLLSMESEIQELLESSDLTESQKDYFMEFVVAVFDLFQMPVRGESAGNVKDILEANSLIDKASLDLYKRFQALIMALTSLVINKSEIGDVTTKFEDLSMLKNSVGGEDSTQTSHYSQYWNLNQHNQTQTQIVNENIKRENRQSTIFNAASSSTFNGSGNNHATLDTQTILPGSSSSFHLQSSAKKSDLPNNKPRILHDYENDNVRSPFTNPKIATIYQNFEKITQEQYNDLYRQSPSRSLRQSPERYQHASPQYRAPASHHGRHQIIGHQHDNYLHPQQDILRNNQSPSLIRTFSHSTPPPNRQQMRSRSTYSSGNRIGPDLDARVVSYNLNHSPSSYKSREEANKRLSMNLRQQPNEIGKRERYLRTRSVYEPRDTLKYPNNNDATHGEKKTGPLNNRASIISGHGQIPSNDSSRLPRMSSPGESERNSKRMSMFARSPSVNFNDSFVQELKGQISDNDGDDHYEDDHYEDIQYDYDGTENGSILSGISTSSSKRFSTRF